MPSGSTIAAIVTKYESLTVTNFPSASRPTIWLDEAPQEEGAGAQQRVPYTVIEDLGSDPEWTFGTTGQSNPGQNAIDGGRFSITVYYASTDVLDGMNLCDLAMAAILWNGGNPNARLGIAFMAMDLASPLRSMSVVPRKSKRSYAGASFQGKPVYMLRQEFTTQAELVGAGYS